MTIDFGRYAGQQIEHLPLLYLAQLYRQCRRLREDPVLRSEIYRHLKIHSRYALEPCPKPAPVDPKHDRYFARWRRQLRIPEAASPNLETTNDK